MSKKKAGQGPELVIRRVKKIVAGGHQGGTWKIAYADFVTALMAFFLLMWLLGSTTKGDLKGISDYFKTPLAVSISGGPGSGTATSVVQGGGKDLTRVDAGEIHKGVTREDKLKPHVTAEQLREDKARLETLRSRLHAFIQATPYLEPFRDQIRLDITREGLLIQITDEQNRPMFDSGSTVLKDYTKKLLESIGRMLNEVENKVSVAGHTDAKPYSGDERGYSNWELSSERANAARRELVIGGMRQNKVLQMRGLADAQPLFEEDPFHPANRRISILVLNKESEQNFYLEGKTETQ
ncbi:MAG: flagellar motor protein MotB [Rhodocyclaceae bacterium]|nr:flagellar motor protein MotB [Rhodocyclaceae bacterium]